MDWDLWSSVSERPWDTLLILKGILESQSTQWQRFVVWFESFRKAAEPFVWVLGSLLALVPGSFAIYKWLYYRYSRLPYRLDDMLLKEEERLRNARTRLLAIIQRPTPIRPFKSPIFVVPSLSRAMRQLKWVRWRSPKALTAADSNLELALTEIETQLRFWDEKHANYKRQRATAYLLRGAIAAANGTKKRVDGKDGLEHQQTALNYFLKALEIDESDHEALEYAAHQQRRLGQIDEALSSYAKLEQLTNRPEPEYKQIRMRALRYSGELLEKKYDETNVNLRLQEANNKLREALDIAPSIAYEGLDHAFIHRVLASVESKRGIQRWRQHCESAERIFLYLIERKREVKEAKRGLQEVLQFKKQIEATSDAAPFEQLSLPEPVS